MKRDKVNMKIGKVTVTYNVLRDGWGDVRGYSLGDYKLVKHYTWGNSYEWVIAKRDTRVATTHCECWRQFDNGDILEIANSCKTGKERLADLYIEGVRLW